MSLVQPCSKASHHLLKLAPCGSGVISSHPVHLVFVYSGIFEACILVSFEFEDGVRMASQ